MAKRQIGTDTDSVRSLGDWIGQSLGEGIAQGMQNAMGGSSDALQPLVDEIVNALRQQLIAAQAAAAPLAAHDSHDESYQDAANDDAAQIARAEEMRPCIEEGCTEAAVSRNLCRRHYARKLYQERKERLGATGFRVVQPRTIGSFGGEPVAERKPHVAAVAPIIRRKRADGADAPAAAAPAPITPITPSFKPAFEIAPDPIAAKAAQAGVTPEAIARAWGLVKE